MPKDEYKAWREKAKIKNDVQLTREEKEMYLVRTLQKTVANGKSTQEEVDEILEAFGINREDYE